MKTILIAAVIAFAVTVVIGKPIIRWLQKQKFGQKILEIGPKWHMNKQYTPTMGGFMFMIGISAAVGITGLLLGVFSSGGAAIGSFFSVWLLAVAYGCVGFVDDWAKIKKKENAGLTPKQKLILQIVVAAVFVSLLHLSGDLPMVEGGGILLPIPGTSISLTLPWVVYLIFAIFTIVAENNAVNLTDGIDGLAASVTLPVAVFFMALNYGHNLGATVFAAALVGALCAFLIYNFNPAKVFMGDTGSLFLGGAVAGLAFAAGQPLILLPVGLIYLVETISVVLQVGYFKLSHGKRLFKMAPIHHHFEMCGWGEKKIVFVFAGITVIMCALSWVLL
ncbi:MAG: phospho-N-acetylmuramoyl-pentapeptide-transferase [Butyricicoccus pullicaecorum]|nr:phospho-N-acetylmuramoyl-pentapeptide-transferase [Butyricicoccus pullicaecorum]MDO4668327.1 phospho-N-acetylmuramoyl-pentapeptide-transferase [Butyricicoccus pullicaecorum]